MATAVKTPAKQAVPETAPVSKKPKAAKQQAVQEVPGKDSSSSSDATGPQLSPENSRSLLLILHGKRVDDDLVKDAISKLKQQGHKISVRVTFDRGDVDKFVSEAVRLNSSGVTNYQTLVAGGGDGTLNEVVCALMKHKDQLKDQDLSVALLPLGTANDFACVSGISVDPYAALLTALDPTNIHSIDVAAVNGQPFMNTAIAGSLAESSPDELSSKWKRIFGPAAIGFHVLKRLLQPNALQPHKQVTITFCSEPGASLPPQMCDTNQNPPGTSTDKSNNGHNNDKVKTLTADLLMLAAGNSRQMGRRVNVCPDALLDDGLLDFTLLTGQSLTAEATGILSTLASRGSDRAACEHGIAQLRASWLEVKVAEGSDDKMPVNRDGEPEEASSRLLFEVYPQILQFHMPDDRMLKQHQQLETATSTESIASVGDIRGNIISGGSPTDAPAGAGTSTVDGKQHAKKQKKTKHRKLRKRTLQRMVVAVQPEGGEVRRRAQLVKAGKQLARWTMLMVVGGVVGWIASARKHGQGSKKEQQTFVQDGLVPASSHSNKKQRHGKFRELTADAKFEKSRLAVTTA